MPPKSLFDNKHRPDKLVMPACEVCNRDTSTADLTAAIISRWNYNANAQSLFDHEKLTAQVRTQAPELLDEWSRVHEYGTENARWHLMKHGVPVPPDAGIRVIGPLTICQLNLFAHKMVLALYFECFRVPLSLKGGVCAFWRTKEDFASEGLPPLLLEMMPHYSALVQGRWDTRETFEYRHVLNRDDGLFGCIARFRQGLFVVGFAASNVAEVTSVADWISPADPSVLLQLPSFHKKN
jgi:hypothetical protein